MLVVGLLVVVAVLWYLLRAVGLVFGPAGRAVAALRPWTARLHGWVLTAPATFGYAAIFTASTFVQFSAPPRLITLLTTLQSTNLHGLRTRPVQVLVVSALWVADRGVGLALYLAAFCVVVAWAERRYGTPRMILIWLAGHVLGSLLTAAVELHAIRTGRAPRSLALSTDVGVSYVMVAGCVAAVVLMRRWLRIAGIAALAVGVVVPVFVHHTSWDLGHLIATLCGLACALALLAVRPPRAPVPVSEAAAAVAVRGQPRG
jgi:hypothetical protein